jgi:hypothetical protein
MFFSRIATFSITFSSVTVSAISFSLGWLFFTLFTIGAIRLQMAGIEPGTSPHSTVALIAPHFSCPNTICKRVIIKTIYIINH